MKKLPLKDFLEKIILNPLEAFINDELLNIVGDAEGLFNAEFLRIRVVECSKRYYLQACSSTALGGCEPFVASIEIEGNETYILVKCIPDSPDHDKLYKLAKDVMKGIRRGQP